MMDTKPDSIVEKQGKNFKNRWKTIPIVLIISILLVLVIGVFVLLRGQSGDAQRQDAEKSGETQAITLRLGHNIIEDSAMHDAALRYAREVESKSHGKLRVSVHPAEQLGNDLQMLEMAKEGKLDIVLTPTAKLSMAIPAMQYADLPFYFSSPEELYAMLDGEPGHLLLSRMKDIGLVGVAFWGNGFKNFSSTRPLRRPEDFRKLRFRTMKSRLIMEQFEALEAKSLPIEFLETYKALADGVVDGQENPLVAFVGMNFYKVQPHLTLSKHAYLAYTFSISAGTYERLSPEMRDLLGNTARELAGWQRAEVARREAALLQQVRAAGVRVHELTPDERNAFAAALSPLIRKYEPVIGSGLLAKTEELRWQAVPPEQRARTLLLGLDADLSVDAEVGMSIRRGMQLAANEINAGGGLMGRQLRIVARDHRGIPGEGIRNMQAFSSMPEMLAVFGGKHSNVIIEEMELIHDHKMPYLVPWAASSSLTRNGHQPNYIFRLSLHDQDVAPFLMEKAGSGGRKVALLLEQSVWGRSNEEAVKQWVQAGGGKAPVATVWFNRGEQDFTAAMAEIERAGAGALVLVANSAEATLIANRLAQSARPLPVFSHWGVIGAGFQKNAGEAIAKLDWYTVSTLPKYPESKMSAPALRLLKRYRETYGIAQGESIPAFMGAAHAYDLVNLLAAAVRASNSTVHQRVQAALEKLSGQPGVVRTYPQPFTAQRHDALNRGDLKLVHFDKQGYLIRAE